MKLSFQRRNGTEDEADLVQRARDGDLRAFETLYRENVGRMNAVCLRMTRDPGKAEECVQEAFVRAWQKIETFAGASSFSTWLHRIAVNEVLGMQRREQRQGRHLRLVAEHEEISRGGSTGQADRTAQSIDLEEAIGELPEGARNVFVLTGINGYTHEEAADMLGIAVGTSKAQLHRARGLLATRLGQSTKHG